MQRCAKVGTCFGRVNPQVTDATIGHLADLIPSWERSLRAANKAPRTRQGYAEAARRLNAFLEANGMPTEVAKLRREHVEHFIDHLVQTYKPATASNRFRSLQQLFKWLEEEGEVTVSPMARMHPPKVPEVPVPVLGDDDCAACSPPAPARSTSSAGTPPSSPCSSTPACD